MAVPFTPISPGDEMIVSGKKGLPLPEAKRVYQDIDTFIFDCDGVLWRGNQPIKGAAQAIQDLRSQGKRVLFVSNNSTKSRAEYVKKFATVGIQAKAEDVYSSAWAAAEYLSRQKFTQDAYVIGQSGIITELAHRGITCQTAASSTAQKKEEAASSSQPPTAADWMTRLKSWKPSDRVGAVVIGMDADFNYLKMAQAQRYLSRPSCLFVATNTDSAFPAEGGVFYPGSGALVQSVMTASNRQPVIAGKPEPLILDVIVEKFGLDRKRTLMVGDRLETDILFGQRGKLQTLLVLTGVTSQEQLLKATIQPHFVASSIAKLCLP